MAGKTKLVTEGPSPKAIAAAALPLVAGIVLLLVDKLAMGDSIDDTVWQTLLLSALPIGGGAAAASPGVVRRRQR